MPVADGRPGSPASADFLDPRHNAISLTKRTIFGTPTDQVAAGLISPQPAPPIAAKSKTPMDNKSTGAIVSSGDPTAATSPQNAPAYHSKPAARAGAAQALLDIPESLTLL